MKTVTKIFPILLVVLMVLSAYSLLSAAGESASQYKQLIKQGDEKASEGLVIDAASFYEQALALKDNVDLKVKIGQVYLDNGYGSKAVAIGESLVEDYPKEAKAYDFLLTCYNRAQNYDDCYEIIDTAEKRKISSEVITEVKNKIAYLYDFDSCKFEEVSDFSNDYSVVKYGEKFGYSTKKGKYALPAVYLDAGFFYEDLAPIKDENGEVYYIDKDGYKRKVIPEDVKCEMAGTIVDGMVVVFDGQKYNYYNDNFKFKFGPFDYAGTMIGGVAAVKEGESWYLVNKKGEKINKTPYEDIILNEREMAYYYDRVFVKTGGSYIMVDGQGKQVGSQKFEDAVLFAGKGDAAVKIGGKWGFVNLEGEITIKPQFDDAKSFNNELAAVCKDGVWGYIAPDGEMKIPAQYEYAMDFNSSGYAFVKYQERWSTIMLYRLNY